MVYATRPPHSAVVTKLYALLSASAQNTDTPGGGSPEQFTVSVGQQSWGVGHTISVSNNRFSDLRIKLLSHFPW